MKYFISFFLALGVVNCFFIKAFAEEGRLDMDKITSLQERQKHFIQHLPKEDFSSCEDWTDATFLGSLEDKLCGEALLRDGKVACLLLAGGQGSRLGEGIAKGRVEVSILQKKSLFQIFFEKILYAGLQCGRKLQIAVMTSSYNHEETVEFLRSHNFFGLSQDQVHFFTQGDLPFCDEEGNWLSKDPDLSTKGPNGNGLALHHMQESGVLDLFYNKGIEHINVIQIDNPLADPFDATFLGFHFRKGSEISVIGVTRESEGEKAGVIASDRGSCRIIEYTEKLNGSFSLLNTGLFCFSMDFIQRVVKERVELPWHAAYKKQPSGHFVWKFEYFIFDLFPYAKRVSVLVKPRAECFSPLKNATGEKSLDTVRRDLLQKDRAMYRFLTGKEPPLEEIELSFDFYYPKEEEILRWKEGKWPDKGYITPKVL